MNNVSKNFPESEETQKGHMCNQRQGVRSTKVLNHQVTERTPEEKKRDVLITVYKPKGMMHTKQTGKSPHRSIRGNKYQTILHEIDGNYTWIEPMKNKTEGEMILAWRRALDSVKDQGILPKHQVLENEISAAYIIEIKMMNTTFQIVPPDDHHRNLSEKAIRSGNITSLA